MVAVNKTATKDWYVSDFVEWRGCCHSYDCGTIAQYIKSIDWKSWVGNNFALYQHVVIVSTYGYRCSNKTPTIPWWQSCILLGTGRMSIWAIIVFDANLGIQLSPVIEIVVKLEVELSEGCQYCLHYLCKRNHASNSIVDLSGRLSNSGALKAVCVLQRKWQDNSFWVRMIRIARFNFSILNWRQWWWR